jgi:hypothetical protein
MIILHLFLFVSMVAYFFQIGIFLISTFVENVTDTFDSKWTYLSMLVPFTCWYFLFKKVRINISDLK